MAGINKYSTFKELIPINGNAIDYSESDRLYFVPIEELSRLAYGEEF